MRRPFSDKVLLEFAQRASWLVSFTDSHGKLHALLEGGGKNPNERASKESFCEIYCSALVGEK
jgi:hypothetical protein